MKRAKGLQFQIGVPSKSSKSSKSKDPEPSAARMLPHNIMNSIMPGLNQVQRAAIHPRHRQERFWTDPDLDEQTSLISEIVANRKYDHFGQVMNNLSEYDPVVEANLMSLMQAMHHAPAHARLVAPYIGSFS